jgi:hypothetical protein
MGQDWVGALAILCVFGTPMLLILTSHHRKMLEMKLRMHNQGDESLRASVDQLRAEVRSLRDTTTQYDMSFDTALQRIERRVDSLENHAITSRAEPLRNIEIQSGR